MTFLKYSILAIGGAIGTICRYALSTAMYAYFSMPVFPIGTLIVNLLGCFIIGILAGFSEKGFLEPVNARLFLFVGLLGGFTTFSAFSIETLNLIRQHQWRTAATYLTLSNVGGIALAFLGVQMALMLVRK